MRPGFIVGIGLFLLTPLAAQPDDPARRADVYSIYSLMFTNPATSHGPDDNEIYLIEDTTVPGNPQQPCVRPPDAEASRFAEVMSDFTRHQSTRVKLESAFQVAKPFRLLNAGDAGTLYRNPAGLPRDLKPHATDLFRLSDVYFNANRTLALTAISTWCGGVCGLFQWKVFEKSADKWEEQNWITCSAIARLGVHRDLIAQRLHHGVEKN